MPLTQLPVGQTGLVRQVCGDSMQVRRLAELGIRRGARLRMFLPGKTCIVQLAGTKLCLRPGQTVEIFVEPEL
jgi:Fe2+ transport system protein FeoA